MFQPYLKWRTQSVKQLSESKDSDNVKTLMLYIIGYVLLKTIKRFVKFKLILNMEFRKAHKKTMKYFLKYLSVKFFNFYIYL